jgi:hypothetical protein
LFRRAYLFLYLSGGLDVAENNTIESCMPYAEKLEKAKKIAGQLLNANDLVREVELEVIAEDDKHLADLVKDQIAALRSVQAASPVQFVHDKKDLDKLTPRAQEAIKDVLDRLGGVMPKGGLFQVKLDGVAGLDAAVDAIISNGTIDMGSLVISKLAAVKAAMVGQAIAVLIEHAHKLKKEMPKSGTGNPQVREATATIKRIDDAISATFGQHDFEAAIKLCEELTAPEVGRAELLKQPATILSPTSRVRKMFNRFGINTLGDVVSYTANQLLEKQNFGIGSLRWLRRMLSAHGLKLKDD